MEVCPPIHLMRSLLAMMCLVATFALVCMMHATRPMSGLSVVGAAVTASPPPAVGAFAKPAAAVRFWHLTDVHINLWHQRHGDTEDMCRSASSNASRRPGRFGHFNCDPDLTAVELAVAHMVQEEPAPDFILFGGDVFGHVPASRENAPSVRKSHEALALALQERFSHTAVLPCLGNHDTHPYFVLGAEAGDALSTMANLYGSALKPSERKTLIQRGYYVHKLRRNRLWVVVLETNALSIPSASVAADLQLSWLEHVLKGAALHAVSVLILGHIAPGASHIDFNSMAAAGWSGGGWTARSQAVFYRLLRENGRLAGRISAMLFGHLHTGSVRLLRPTAGEKTASWASDVPLDLDRGSALAVGDYGDEEANDATMPVMYLSPSLTSRNPTPHRGGLRLYTLSSPPSRRQPLHLTDIDEYSFELDASNAQGKPLWTAASVRSSLNLSSLTYIAWRRWAHSLRDDATFGWLMSAQRCADEVEPDYAKCKASVVCAHTELEVEGYIKCLQAIRQNAIRPSAWAEAVKRAV